MIKVTFIKKKHDAGVRSSVCFPSSGEVAVGRSEIIPP
jgi:hypothetical protein